MLTVGRWRPDESCLLLCRLLQAQAGPNFQPCKHTCDADAVSPYILDTTDFTASLSSFWTVEANWPMKVNACRLN